MMKLQLSYLPAVLLCEKHSFVLALQPPFAPMPVAMSTLKIHRIHIGAIVTFKARVMCFMLIGCVHE